MTTIKRFTPDYKMHAVRFEAFAREAEHGEYVKFDAHQRAVSALEVERDALADRVKALAVENAEMRGVIDAAIGVANNSSGIAGWHLNGEIADWDEILPELNIETPATDAALAAIQAQGVEKAAEYTAHESSRAEFINSDVSSAFAGLADDLLKLAAELREAK
ncbi:hypothetical protein P9A06_25670 [Serratia marcescens]|uniref:hypothetical protein n=1 Tax=Serratia marcescens TaxID=615 RepID=UPI0032046769